MKLATSAMIPLIDKYAEEVLNIPTTVLMERSGNAVAAAVREIAPKDKPVIILAGRGNNGGDGYAAALKLTGEYDVTVYDVFSAGQKSDAGKYFMQKYLEVGGKKEDFQPSSDCLSQIKKAGCIVDAIFGTGFKGEIPEILKPLVTAVNEAHGARKIAVDLPLGIDADSGSVGDFAICSDITVALSFIKPGTVSYPARSYVGRLIYDTLGLPREAITDKFDFKYHMIDGEWVSRNMKKREENSNKGSFGKLLMITGSKKYRGAAHLTLEAALRGGVGLVSFLGNSELTGGLMQKYPEVIYKNMGDAAEMTAENLAETVRLSKSHSMTLVGSGSDNTDGLRALVLALLSAEGGPLILDADAINALADAGEKGRAAIKESKREVLITPHPLEFARLLGVTAAEVQRNRIDLAKCFAREHGCTVILKGAGTVITDGDEVYINSTGSSALAKAGSGDVLAGFTASFSAQNKTDLLKSAAISVYFHGLAGDSLKEKYSSYGVTPSDLPTEIAKELAKHEKEL